MVRTVVPVSPAPPSMQPGHGEVADVADLELVVDRGTVGNHREGEGAAGGGGYRRYLICARKLGAIGGGNHRGRGGGSSRRAGPQRG